VPLLVNWRYYTRLEVINYPESELGKVTMIAELTGGGGAI